MSRTGAILAVLMALGAHYSGAFIVVRVQRHRWAELPSALQPAP